MSINRRSFLRKLGLAVALAAMPLLRERPPASLEGFPGTEFLRSGYILAPYCSLYSTPEVLTVDFTRNRFTAASFLRPLRGDFYKRSS